MDKFTPGPWKFYQLHGEDGLGYIRREDEDGKEIAHHGDPDRSFQENVANARLIAAAPDMLAALRRGRVVMAGECDTALASYCRAGADGALLREAMEPDERRHVESLEGAIAKIDAAIAKAEGGS